MCAIVMYSRLARRYISHFTRLGLQPTFDIDSLSLQKAFHAKQKALHVDASNLPSTESESSACNIAYETLKHPLSRSLYMLQTIHKIDLQEDGVKQLYAKLTHEATQMVYAFDEMHETHPEESLLQMVLHKNIIETQLTTSWKHQDLHNVVKHTIQLQFLSKCIARHT